MAFVLKEGKGGRGRQDRTDYCTDYYGVIWVWMDRGILKPFRIFLLCISFSSSWFFGGSEISLLFLDIEKGWKGSWVLCHLTYLPASNPYIAHP